MQADEILFAPIKAEDPTNPVVSDLEQILTLEQAIAKRSALMKNEEWVSRYLAGGPTELMEMLTLNIMIIGGK